MGPREPSIAIVGCGYMGSRHALTYARLKKVQLLLVDKEESLARQLAKQLSKLGISAQPASWPDVKQLATEMNRTPGPTKVAIDICTPPQFHAPYIREALLADCPVLCEKPLTTCNEVEEQLLSLVSGSQGWLAVGYPYRHHPAMQWLRDLLKRGELGKPHIAYLRLGARGGRHSWKHQNLFGGGVHNEVLCHLVDLAIHLFGPIENGRTLDQQIIRKTRTIAGIEETVTAPDYGILALVHDNGVQSVLLADMISPGFVQSVEIQAQQGSLWSSIRPEWPSWVQKKEPLTSPDTQLVNHASVDLLEQVLAAFLRSLEKGKPESILRPYPGVARWL